MSKKIADKDRIKSEIKKIGDFYEVLAVEDGLSYGKYENRADAERRQRFLSYCAPEGNRGLFLMGAVYAKEAPDIQVFEAAKADIGNDEGKALIDKFTIGSISDESSGDENV